MVRILNTKYQNTDKYKVNPLHVNVGLGGDDLELETNKKGKTSVGPRQAVVKVSIFLPKMDSRHVYRHIAFDIAFNAQTVCILNILDHT